MCMSSFQDKKHQLMFHFHLFHFLYCMKQFGCCYLVYIYRRSSHLLAIENASVLLQSMLMVDVYT